MALNAHGKYDLEVRGEIFIPRFYHVWNEECSKEFFENYKCVIREKNFKQFGVLADFNNLEGATPEAIAYFRNISQWTLDNGQIARAQLLNSALNKYIVNLPSQGLELFSIKTFEDEEPALIWLAQQGLKIE